MGFGWLKKLVDFLVLGRQAGLWDTSQGKPKPKDPRKGP